MDYINQNNVLEYLNALEPQSQDCDHSPYLGWENIVNGYELDLVKVGEIEQETTEEVEVYWGEEAPIRLNVYPYPRCDILQCKKCKQLFFFYRELSGHRPQKRYRLIQKELIDVESIVPTKRCQIFSKPYHYAIYKLPDLSFELSISKSVNLGVEVYHTLNKEEIKQFKSTGIESLKSRIKDMNDNYSKYRVVSWR